MLGVRGNTPFSMIFISTHPVRWQYPSATSWWEFGGMW